MYFMLFRPTLKRYVKEIIFQASKNFFTSVTGFTLTLSSSLSEAKILIWCSQWKLQNSHDYQLQLFNRLLVQGARAFTSCIVIISRFKGSLTPLQETQLDCAYTDKKNISLFLGKENLKWLLQQGFAIVSCWFSFILAFARVNPLMSCCISYLMPACNPLNISFYCVTLCHPRETCCDPCTSPLHFKTGRTYSQPSCLSPAETQGSLLTLHYVLNSPNNWKNKSACHHISCFAQPHTKILFFTRGLMIERSNLHLLPTFSYSYVYFLLLPGSHIWC